MRGVLLDTCAIIFASDGRLKPGTMQELAPFFAADMVYFSPVSAWEIALLGRSRRNGPRLTFSPNPVDWFARFRREAGLQDARFTVDIAMEAALLPGNLHADPTDRFLIATARRRGIPLVTSDRRILAYAAEGHLDAIACFPERPPP